LFWDERWSVPFVFMGIPANEWYSGINPNPERFQAHHLPMFDPWFKRVRKDSNSVTISDAPEYNNTEGPSRTVVIQIYVKNPEGAKHKYVMRNVIQYIRFSQDGKRVERSSLAFSPTLYSDVPPMGTPLDRK